MNKKKQIKVFGSILTVMVLNAAISLAQVKDIREGLVAWWSRYLSWDPVGRVLLSPL